MTVLHLLKTSVGARWALRQMAELVRLGHDIHVLLPPGGSLVQECHDAGISVHLGQPAVDPQHPFRAALAIQTIRRCVAAVQPAIVHSHFVATTIAMRAALRGDRRPRLFQVPGPLHLEHGPTRMADLASAGPEDAWIGTCRWTCDRYRLAGVPPSRVFLSYYGTALDTFDRRASGPSSRDAVSPSARVVAMVAYMYAPKRLLGQRRGLKGHEDLIDALHLVRQSDPSVVGVFAGGAWDSAERYENSLRARAFRACGDSIQMLGTVTDVGSVYRRADVAVHPSHSENVGGAVESLLMGVPTITTTVGGFPDLVIEGQTGRLVPPRNPGALAGAIREVLSEPDRYREMAGRGRTLARELFDVRRTAREVSDVYRKLAA